MANYEKLKDSDEELIPVVAELLGKPVDEVRHQFDECLVSSLQIAESKKKLIEVFDELTKKRGEYLLSLAEKNT